MTGRTPLDERRRRVAASLQVGNPGDNARSLGAPRDAESECQLELTVEEIRAYEHNPRRSANPKFDDIKESIRTSGLRSPLTVTRRPGEAHFIVEAGGNTRLLALKQLWAETLDVRYRELTVLFRPWRSESHVLTAHLIENEQRGDMSFWDKASGIVALKGRLEEELGESLALRPLEDALHGLGISVNTATLAHYLFALDRLGILGESIPKLSGLDVKTLQPRLNALKRVAQSQGATSEDDLYERVFNPAFQRAAEDYRRTQSFSVLALSDACEEALAQYLGQSVVALRQALQTDGARRPAAAHVVDVPRVGVPASTESGRSKLADVDSGGSTCASIRFAAERFASLAALPECVLSRGATETDFRIAPLVETAHATIDQQRAWWLLAGACGQLTSDVPAPVPLDRDFLAWLLNPEDESSAAFWSLAETLRHARRGDPACRDTDVTTPDGRGA